MKRSTKTILGGTGIAAALAVGALIVRQRFFPAEPGRSAIPSGSNFYPYDALGGPAKAREIGLMGEKRSWGVYSTSSGIFALWRAPERTGGGGPFTTVAEATLVAGANASPSDEGDKAAVPT